MLPHHLTACERLHEDAHLFAFFPVAKRGRAPVSISEMQWLLRLGSRCPLRDAHYRRGRECTVRVDEVPVARSVSRFVLDRAVS